MSARRFLFAGLMILAFPNLFGQKSQQLHHIIMYGQSLMLGTSSVPVITDRQKYNTLMFAGGVRSGYDTTSAAFYNGFVPLREKRVTSKNTGSSLGETPASGFSETMIGLMVKEDHYNFSPVSDNNFQLLISSPAQGSSSIEDLSGGAYWERFKRDVTEAHRLAVAAGKIYDVPVILWNQGERDIDLSTSPEVYKQSIIAFRKKADEFIRSVTGQRNPVRFIMYQVCSHNVRKGARNPEIANAQYELAKTEPFITMSATTYQLPFSSDHVHFTNVGSKWNGAYHGVAAKRIIVDRKEWRPIFVRRSAFRKNVITLRFHVPSSSPLVFDTVSVSNPGHYGFSVRDNAGKEIEIENVTIAKGETVKITLAEKVRPGYYVWYGYNGSSTGAESGARGNLRDNQGNTITIDINGSPKRLDNWCPILRETLEK